MELQEKNEVTINAALEKQYAANPAAILNSDGLVTITLMEVGVTIDTAKPIQRAHPRNLEVAGVALLRCHGSEWWS